MRSLIISSLFVLATSISPITSAGDVDAGKSKAASCTACHGQHGVSSNPEWPNLAGQNAKYLISQLKGFRDGERSSALMSPMAKQLSDSDIADISAYYESLK